MDRYRIEWQDGPRLAGADTWVIDLDLLCSSGQSPFRFAKKIQVVATTDDIAAIGPTPVDHDELEPGLAIGPDL